MHKHPDAVAERLRRQQKALAEFGLHAFRSTELDEILHRAAELVADGLEVRRAKVLELLPGGEELLVRAGVGWDPYVVGVVRFDADSHSPAGHALSHERPVVSPDLDAENRFEIPQVLVDHGIRSMVNVIIAGDDGPFGVLEVDAARQRDFDDDDIAFLSTYANLLAAAVERTRSHLSLAEVNREQKVLVQELAHRAKNMLGLVQSLASQTTADHPAARAFQEAFLGRLEALARAEDLIFDDHAQIVDLARLVARSVEPFEETARGSIRAEGPFGLGYTARAVLDHGTVASLTIVEMLGPVIDWHREGLLPLGRGLLCDPRVRIVQGDFFSLAASAAGFDQTSPERRFHAILVDIDHSPDALLDARSGSFYGIDGLTGLASKLRPGGIFGLWSNDRPDRKFEERLSQVFAAAWAEPVTFFNPLQDRPFTQTVYLALKAPSVEAAP